MTCHRQMSARRVAYNPLNEGQCVTHFQDFNYTTVFSLKHGVKTEKVDHCTCDDYNCFKQNKT